MSSDDEALIRGAGLKKRKLQRACDRCKQRKIRCGGSQGFDSKCENCLSDEAACTWTEAEKSRRRNYTRSYVDGLEARLRRAEALLAKLHPGIDFSKELDGTTTPMASPSPFESTPSKNSPLPSLFGLSSQAKEVPLHKAGPVVRLEDTATVDSSDEDFPVHTLSEQVAKMKMHPSSPRFVGKSSGIRLVFEAFLTKHKTDHTTFMLERAKRIMSRRPQFWTIAPWEARDVDCCEAAVSVNYRFPELDVIPVLVNSYFENCNRFLPLLHRPTFDSQLSSQLYLRDPGFAGVFLLVCANGARYLDDPRFRLEGETSPASSGWRWFNQVQMTRKSLWATPCLEDIQSLALAAIFLFGSSSPQACWTLTGVGLRLAQDVGAHRKKVYSTLPKGDEELWRRAFWVLLTSDRILSYMLGRTTAIHDEDFDVEEPLDCDDEYWNNANREEAFKQPTGKPSTMTFFLHLIKLHRILALTMRTLYSINRSRTGSTAEFREWEQQAVADLDSELNKWIDNIPSHLRWDPAQQDTVFFDQSAYIYSQYYLVQIFVHRRFIPTYGKRSSQSLSSQAVCTTAARASCHLVDIQQKRTGKPHAYQASSAITSGVVLLLNIWGIGHSARNINIAKEMEDVRTCMDVLQRCESHWPSAGRSWDILFELASANELPLPEDTPSLKRARYTSEGPSAGLEREKEGTAKDADVNGKHTQSSAIPVFGMPQPLGSTTGNPPSIVRPFDLQCSQPSTASLFGPSSSGHSISTTTTPPVDGVNATNTGSSLPEFGVSGSQSLGIPFQAFTNDDTLGMWWNPPSELGGDNWDSFLYSLRDLEGQALEAQRYP